MRPAACRRRHVGAGLQRAGQDQSVASGLAEGYRLRHHWRRPTGLSAAYHLGRQDTLLLERNRPWAAGAARSGQRLHLRLRRPHHVLQRPVCAEAVRHSAGRQPALAEPRSLGLQQKVFTRYPFQGALYGLPPDVIKECIVGAIEARYGSTAPTIRRRQCGGSGTVDDCCADGGRRRQLPAPPRGAGEAAQLRGIHLQGVGRRHRQAFRDPVQQEAVDRAAERDGNLVAGRPGAAAGPGRDHRRRAAAGGQADGAERALRLSAARAASRR
jgi:hypothetical protein